MKTELKRLISLQGLLLLFVFTAIFLSADIQKVSAEEQQKLPYLIKVNRACNTITVYEEDEIGQYTIPVKVMVCSVGKGTRTITGTFQTKEKYRWKLLMGDVWGQYATRIVGGILFHSVYYYRSCDPASLATKEFNKLGTAASHGCIRLTVEDAKWIYDNCTSGTTVIIYDDKKDPGPMGKPGTITLPDFVRWDPTDPSEKNPYKDKLPKITGAKNITAEWGNEINLLNGIKAKSSFGTDITDKLTLEGEVDFKQPGKYDITYSVKDDLGRSCTKKVTVTVNENPTPPEFTGICDRLANKDAVIDEAFVLNGVEAYRSGVKLPKDLIEVTIKEINAEQYYITYQINMDNLDPVTSYATIQIDREAPVLYGIMDFRLEYGELPSEGFLLSNVTASDNYSKPEDITITAVLEENSDGSYQVIYEAIDEAGNKTIEKVAIIN